MAEKKGRLLCVDDEPGILRSLKWLLQKDFDVKTAGSGLEALELVRSNDFDVIISDQRMPGMNGAEFLREAARIAPRPLRILLTGYSDLDAVVKSVNESEIYRFVNKPWHIDELPRIVAEAADIARTRPVPDAAATVVARAPVVAETPETVLVIDEDPAVGAMLAHVVEGRATVLHSDGIADAVAKLAAHPEIGVVVSDTNVRGSDATRLLKLLKSRRPDIVTVAFSQLVDANEIISLINHGQLFRYVQKPARDAYLNLVMTAALTRRKELRQSPEIGRRFSVQAMAAEVRDAFAAELQQMAGAMAAQPAAVGAAAGGGSLFQRMTSGLRLLFG